MDSLRSQERRWTWTGTLAAGVMVTAALAVLLGPVNRPLMGILIGMAVGIILLSLQGRLETEKSAGESGDAAPLSAHLLRIQEQERKTLSRELHDGVGQNMTALKMEIARISPPTAEDRARLERARNLASEVLQTIRNISLLLRPTILDDLGLQDALQWHAEDFTRRTSIPCRVTYRLKGDQILNDASRTCVYRIVQEALNNCEKHASAASVKIDVGIVSGQFVVTIEDNGQGASLGDREIIGLGILGMRERATMLNGSLELHSGDGRGTTVKLIIPKPVWASESSEKR